MNEIIKKAIDNGIDSLTDQEYEIYQAEKAKLSTELQAIVKKAVDLGIDGLEDTEYDLYKNSGKAETDFFVTPKDEVLANQYGSFKTNNPKLTREEAWKKLAGETPMPENFDFTSTETNEGRFNRVNQGLTNQGVPEFLAPTLQSAMPRLSSSMAQNGVPDLLSLGTAKNMLLGGLDATSSFGRATRSAMSALGGGDFRQSMSNIDPTSTDMATSMGESILINPLTPLGGGLAKLGTNIGAKGAQMLGSSKPIQSLMGTLGLGGLTSGAEDFQRQQSGQSGIGVEGYALGMGLPFATQGMSKMLAPKAPNTQALSVTNPNASLTENMTQDIINTAKKTGLEIDQVAKIPDYARGVMTNLNDSERQVFKDFQDKALAYHRRDAGAIRPLELEANKWLPEIKTKFNDYRKKIGEEMGAIEKIGLQGGSETEGILNTLKNSFQEDGLDIVINPNTGKAEIVETTLSKISPDDFPELKVVVNEFYNKLPKNATGEELRSAQQRAFRSAKKAVGLGQANQADRILATLDDAIDSELERQMNLISPDLGARYSMVKNKYGEVKDIQEFLGDRTGKELKWTKEDSGDVEKGMQTGASFFQALTNSGSNQRGATFLLDLAQKEFGLPNLQKRAIMARYAEEGAGIRGARQAQNQGNKVSELLDKGRSLVSEKYRAEKLLPEQARISETLSGNKAPKKSSKVLQGASTLANKSTQTASLMGANAKTSDEQAKKNKSKLQGKN